MCAKRESLALVLVLGGCGRTQLVTGSVSSACTNELIADWRPHDIELRTGRVEVDLRLRGARLAATDRARGWLTFREVTGRATARVALGRAAIEPFETRLVTGVYEVSYDAPGSACEESADAMPCLGGVVLRGLEVRPERRRVRIDLRPTRYRLTVQASGRLADRDRRFSVRCGSGEWVGAFAHGVSTEIDALDPKRCSMQSAEMHHCQLSRSCRVPVLDESLDFDPLRPEMQVALRTAKVRFRFDTTPRLEHSTSAHIELVARHHRTGLPTFPSRQINEAEHEIELPMGTYDLDWVVPCVSSATPGAPCGQIVVARGMPLTEDVALRRSVGFTRWRGSLSFTGTAPDWTRANSVGIRLFGSLGHYSVPLELRSSQLEATRRIDVDAWVPSDTRAFALRVSDAAGSLGDEDDMNRRRAPTSLITAYVPFADGLLAAQERTDFSIALHPLVVEFAVRDGQDLSPLGLPLSIGVKDERDPYGVFAPIDTPTLVSFPRRAEVLLHPRSDLAVEALRRAELPTIEHRVRSAAFELSNGFRMVVLDTVLARGSVVVDGAPLDHSTGQEASIEFAPVASLVPVGDARSVSVRTEGAAFSTRLHAGRYTARISQGDCSASERSEKICGSVLVRGCAEGRP
jgi:hypothetical protein